MTALIKSELATRRCFIGVMVAPNCARSLLTTASQAVQQQTDAKQLLRWYPFEKVHLTLRFAGQVDQKRQAMLDDTCQFVASRYRAFSIELRKIGSFPNRNGRFVAALVTLTPDLQALVSVINQRLTEFGFPEPESVYRPHITLARRSHSNRHVVFNFNAIYLPHKPILPISALTLFESVAGPQQSRYIVLGRYPLQSE